MLLVLLQGEHVYGGFLLSLQQNFQVNITVVAGELYNFIFLVGKPTIKNISSRKTTNIADKNNESVYHDQGNQRLKILRDRLNQDKKKLKSNAIGLLM